MLLTLRMPLPASEPSSRHAFVTFDGNRIVDLRIAPRAAGALEAIASRFGECALACEPGLYRHGWAFGFRRHDPDARLKIARLAAAMVLADREQVPVAAHAPALLAVARAAARLWRARPAACADLPVEISGALRASLVGCVWGDDGEVWGMDLFPEGGGTADSIGVHFESRPEELVGAMRSALGIPAAPCIARYRGGIATAPGADELIALAAAVDAIASLTPGASECLHAAADGPDRVWARIRRSPTGLRPGVRV